MSKAILLCCVIVMVSIAGCTTTEPVQMAAGLTDCAEPPVAISLPDYVPSVTSGFVTLREGRFVVGDRPFTARGVNYYPARYPWRRFLTEAENLLGWLVWAAFDFPLDATCIRPACPSQDNAEHHFGLWFPDYTPKPVIEWLLKR
jgi:hypothetical protein